MRSGTNKNRYLLIQVNTTSRKSSSSKTFVKPLVSKLFFSSKNFICGAKNAVQGPKPKFPSIGLKVWSWGPRSTFLAPQIKFYEAKLNLLNWCFTPKGLTIRLWLWRREGGNWSPTLQRKDDVFFPSRGNLCGGHEGCSRECRVGADYSLECWFFRLSTNPLSPLISFFLYIYIYSESGPLLFKKNLEYP